MARKETVIQKVKATFLKVKEAITHDLSPAGYLAPEGTDFTQGQLAHGDRFHGLPWVYLDFPKHFSKEAIFAFRSFFWWGEGFIFAFILGGPHLDQYKANLVHGYDRLADLGLRLSLAEDPWEWRQDHGYTLELTRADRPAVEATLPGRPFLKLQSVLGLEGPTLSQEAIVQAACRTFEKCSPVVKRSEPFLANRPQAIVS